MSPARRIRGRFKKVWVILPLVCLFLVIGSHSYWIRQIGGCYSDNPLEARGKLSSEAVALMEKAWEGIEPSRLLDYHAHIAGAGTIATGIAANPKMLTWWNPLPHLKFLVFLSAAHVQSQETASEEYLARFSGLIESMDRHGRFCVLALDQFHTAAGSPDFSKTTLYVSNDRVLEAARKRPDLFVPAISVHPYRADALQELERGASAGARMVKWIPNAMGIDPADPRCDGFYERMKKLDLVLLSHAGAEHTLESEGYQHLGNPLRLRRALDHGIKVIVAHCASTGSNEDLDHPGGPARDNFAYFMRLMDEKKYEGLLFGDISAITQVNHARDPLKILLRRRDLHARLVNGSDYPLPAVNVVIMTRMLESWGYITGDERKRLKELYWYNPLVFDFVLKRTVRDPQTGGQFAASVFMRNGALRVGEEGF